MGVRARIPSCLSSDKVKHIELQRGTLASHRMRQGPAFDRSSILYEDETMLVVNKPQGVLNEHVLTTASHLLGAPYTPDFPLIKYPTSAAISCFPHMVNLLSRDTSGANLMLKRTNRRSSMGLTRQFMQESVSKTYLGLCAAGSCPDSRNIRFVSGYGRSRGAWRVYPEQDIGRSVEGLSSSRPVVEEAVTELEVLGCCAPTGSEADLGPPRTPRESFGCEVMVRAVITHPKVDQIRVHCGYLGLPLVGDVKYGGPLEWNRVHYQGHALHVQALSFHHPRSHRLMTVTAPAPDWFQKFFSDRRSTIVAGTM